MVCFEARRQGSVYVFDRTATGSNGTLTQVDAWHEADHPGYWSADFDFEAEVHAGLASDSSLTVHTRTELRPGANHALDFVGAISFVEVSVDTPLLAYHFQPRGSLPAGYVVWVRVRTGDAKASGCLLEVALDGDRIGELLHQSDDFCWSRLKQPLVAMPREEPHALSLRALRGRAHIDAVRLARAGKGNSSSPAGAICAGQV